MWRSVGPAAPGRVPDAVDLPMRRSGQTYVSAPTPDTKLALSYRSAFAIASVTLVSMPGAKGEGSANQGVDSSAS